MFMAQVTFLRKANIGYALFSHVILAVLVEVGQANRAIQMCSVLIG